MIYILVVVDEGFLSLINFKMFNLYDVFYVCEVLGVKIWDFYNYILGKENIIVE